MKKTFTKLATFIFGLLMLSSCATIVGGSKYNAHVMVNNMPNAKIYYQGQVRGTGGATIKIPRKDANKVTFTVQEEGCVPQTFKYHSRSFRGWAFVGTIFLWTGVYNGTPLPWGMVLDLATGAVYKPSVSEDNVYKMDYKNYSYLLNYTGCESTPVKVIPETVPQDVVYLKNGGVIRGIIIEQIPNDKIKIKTKDENIFVYKMDEIEKLTKE